MPEEDVFTVSHSMRFHSGQHLEALHTEMVSCESQTWICLSHTLFFLGGGERGRVIIWSTGKQLGLPAFSLMDSCGCLPFAQLMPALANSRLTVWGSRQQTIQRMTPSIFSQGHFLPVSSAKSTFLKDVCRGVCVRGCGCVCVCVIVYWIHLT